MNYNSESNWLLNNVRIKTIDEFESYYGKFGIDWSEDLYHSFPETMFYLLGERLYNVVDKSQLLSLISIFSIGVEVVNNTKSYDFKTSKDNLERRHFLVHTDFLWLDINNSIKVNSCTINGNIVSVGDYIAYGCECRDYINDWFNFNSTGKLCQISEIRKLDGVYAFYHNKDDGHSIIATSLSDIAMFINKKDVHE